MESTEYSVPDGFESAGYKICADELGSIVGGRDMGKLKCHGGVSGIAEKLCTSTTNGFSIDNDSLNRRQELFGINKFDESEPRAFWLYVWQALKVATLEFLAGLAFVSLIDFLATGEWPSGDLDGYGLEIVLAILLVVFIKAISDYRLSLQSRHLDKEKKNISVDVKRNGYRHKMSIYELLPGDIVYLGIGDQVPADGLFVSGFSVFIDESSLKGESELVMITDDNPYMLSGTKVCDGFCCMLVTTVGMRTEWGKLMASLSELGDDGTPLQVKLNSLATVIGKIGLFFAIVTFGVLVQKMFSHKVDEETSWSWTDNDASSLLGYFAIAVTIVVVVVAVPKDFWMYVRVYLKYRHLDRQKELSIHDFKTFKSLDGEEIFPSTTNGVELNSLAAVTDKICDEWGSGVGGRNMKKLNDKGRVSGITEELRMSTTNGLPVDRGSLNLGQEHSGIYMFTESEPSAFWMYVSQALKVTPLEFLAGLAFFSLIGSLATGEWPSGDLDGHGLEIVVAILLVVMIEKFWMKGSFPSTLVAINKLLIACYPISFCAIVTNAQPSNSDLEGDYTSKNFSRNNDEHHSLMLSVKKNWVQGTAMLDWTDIIMFIGIMLLAVTLYYHNWVLYAFCILWTHIIDLMQALKIKMKQGLVKLKKNNIQYLRRGYKLSNLVIASPFLEGGHKWQVCMLVGIALFSIIFYCGEVSVELKKSQVTTSNFFLELRNNKKVLFFTARHVLEISVPLLFSLLAYVRLMEFDRKNHYTKNDWPSFALVLQVAIFVVGWLHIIMDDCNPDYIRQNDQNQLIPMQPVDTIPHKGNEIILKDRPVVPEEISEEGNDLTVAQRSAPNGASVSEMVLEVAEELC
ncbi:hypothetical protein ACET3Z_030621 [Daucus carota]